MTSMWYSFLNRTDNTILEVPAASYSEAIGKVSDFYAAPTPQVIEFMGVKKTFA